MTISLDDRIKIIALRKRGYVYRLIAEEVGVSIASVTNICKSANIPRPKAVDVVGRVRKYDYTPAQAGVVVFLRKQGYVCRTIGEMVGLHTATVRLICNHADLAGTIGQVGRKRAQSPQHERNATMRELRSQGLTLQEIGEKYGITRERVRQICVGVEKPKKELPVKTCGVCGKQFSHKHRKYCSDECSGEAIGASNRRPDSKWSRHGKVKLTCAGCNVEFERSNYIDNIGKTSRRLKGITDSGLRFCSRECYWEHCGDLFTNLRRPKEEDE